MKLIPWSRLLETGLHDVDEQHHHLIDVTNDFGKLLSEDHVDQAALEKVFSELIDYTHYHFEEEEKIMDAAEVDLRHVENHKSEHRNFLEEVNTLASRHSSGGHPERSLFDFLMNWLVYHILGPDRSLGKQIKAIQSGISAAEACRQEEQEADQATSLLLQSLDNLFNQVSERNRELNEWNRTLEQKVEERTRELSKANRRLDELASTDALTGLSNRRHALKILDLMWAEALEKNQGLSCLMIDADGFKQVNDRYGHDAGDKVLCELAWQLQHAVRTDDVVCRLGGDEFLILCPNTDDEGAMKIARDTHAAVKEMKVKVAEGTWVGSISVGVSSRRATMKTPEELIKAADRGVYAAKDAGRNCVRQVGV